MRDRQWIRWLEKIVVPTAAVMILIAGVCFDVYLQEEFQTAGLGMDGERGRHLYGSGTAIAVLLDAVLFFCIWFWNQGRRKRDPLTGMYTKAYFTRNLQGIPEESAGFYICVMNVRRLRFINEIFGRDEGDSLLRHIGRILREETGRDEISCRDSGGTFWMMAKGEDRHLLESRLKHMMDRMSGYSFDRDPGYRFFLYCGVAEIRDSDEMEIGMSHAVLALREAQGRAWNNLVFYDQDFQCRDRVRNYIGSHMDHALYEREFRLFLQPKIHLETGKLAGAEALVRWFAEDGNRLFPDVFVTLFEQNGFCAKLDLYMADMVGRQIRKWMDAGIEPVPVSLNQSKLLFYEDGYVEKMGEVLEKYRIPGELITIEILEGIAPDNIDVLNEKINQLKELGFRISMDDFGSGYSSFHLFGRFHIDELKLDKGFLSELTKEEKEKQRFIISKIVEMAKKLHVSIVAEGVENEENENLVRELGCDYGQGYYFGMPVSAKEFTAVYMK